MVRFVSSSIRNKLYFIVLVAVVSAVLAGSLASAWVKAVRQFEAREHEIQAIAAAMAATTAAPIAKGDRRAMAASLNAIGRIPRVKYATVLDMEGRRLFQHGIGIVVDHGDRDWARQGNIGPLTALNLGTTVARAPIVYGGRNVGLLILILDLSDLRYALIENLILSLLTAAGAAAIGIGVASVLQGSVTKPIKELTDAIEHVRETRDFSAKAVRHSDDETGLMVDAFNDMLAQIRRRDAALARHRDELEITVRDRTRDLYAAKTAAETANAAKSDFLATMSHEIRTPMNGMLVMAELLSASGLEPRLQRYADIVVKSGQSLVTIINDILDFSKIEAGKLELELLPVAPRQLVDDVLQLFSERALSAELEVAAYIAPDVPRTIAADPVRLNQVLTNLVNNALKFTEKGGVIVRVTSRGPVDGAEASAVRLRFEVVDTGIGIPPEKCADIFEAFSQADQSTTRRFGGTGIGLSICQRLIGVMKGEIGVESVVGEGSTFAFEIPVAVLEQADALPPAPVPAPVALLDLADGIGRRTLAAALQDWGFSAVDADGAPAIEGVRLVLADAVRLESRQEGYPESSGVRPAVVALASFGDTRGSRLLAADRVHALLDRPVGSHALTQILRAALTAEDAAGALRSMTTAGSHREPVQAFRGVRVLAADDSPVNREVLAELMRRLEVELTSVEDGLAVVEAAKAGDYDLILMDGSMPGLDGFEATRRIRAWEAETGCPRIPIVALTAHVVGSMSGRWREAGMDDFVSKPFSLATIEACLKRWLAGSPQGTAVALQAAEPVAATLPELIDGDVLQSIRDIQAPGDDLVARVVRLYLDHAPAALDRLRELGTEAPAKDIADAAHALKSLSRNIGAVRVAMLADQLECAAEAGGVPDRSEFDELADALEATLEALRLEEARAA